jgi:hypothetical protein
MINANVYTGTVRYCANILQEEIMSILSHVSYNIVRVKVHQKSSQYIVLE